MSLAYLVGNVGGGMHQRLSFKNMRPVKAE